MSETGTQDARVKSALSHWAPRFVANGIILTDFQEVTASIRSWGEWCEKWSARAVLHEGLGRAALAEALRLAPAPKALGRGGVAQVVVYWHAYTVVTHWGHI